MKTVYNSQPTTDELIAREQGPGRVPSPPVDPDGLPAGQSLWAVPTYQSKVGLLNTIARAYRWTVDEALRHSRTNAPAMLRDLLIRTSLATRWIPVVQLSWFLEPLDATDPTQTDAVTKVTKVIEQTPHWQDFLLENLWSEWFGKGAVSLLYEWIVVNEEKWMVVRDHKPINGDSIIPRWGGDWGQLVNGTFQGQTDIGDGRGLAHYFTPDEREALIIHTAPPEDADFYEPELAGQIAGSGLRGHVYWYWFLKSNFEALLADFGERFANGVWVGYYDSGDANAKTQMEATLTGYTTKRQILLPRTEDGKTAYGLEIIEPGTGNPQFLLSMIELLREMIKDYLTGRSLNDVDVQVGGDGAGLIEDRISRQIKYSATRLAETLSLDFVKILYKYNCPGVSPAKFKFAIESINAGELLGYAERLVNYGYNLPIDEFVETCGLPPGGVSGQNTYSKIQAGAPVTGQQPVGVPQTQGTVPDPTQGQPPPPQQQSVPVSPAPTQAPEPAPTQNLLA